ncbi:MAG: DUF1848 domain-containing protein [Lachnospiraceae bacterium]|nr:DUF1848 domain-containing protein [Lachnospiraceae bacterium]
MILQTGLRTDIPAFYARWFANRLQAGFVCVRNPYNPVSVTRYILSPEVVDLIGFCTKNPAPMFPYMDLLAPYGQYWFVTITPYGKDIEPNVPAKEIVMNSFRKLSDMVGVDSVGWRYDPILISDVYPVERHISDFERMAACLSGYTKICVISFIDIYRKVERNFPQARPVRPAERMEIGKAFAEIGRRYGMTIKACAEGNDLAAFGIDCSGCMTMETFEQALHCRLDAPKRKSARSECSCYLGSDIGAYDTCGHLCRYCYANANAAAVRQNMRLHNPESPFLTGEGRPEDQIHEAKQSSWIDRQMSLF